MRLMCVEPEKWTVVPNSYSWIELYRLTREPSSFQGPCPFDKEVQFSSEPPLVKLSTYPNLPRNEVYAPLITRQNPKT